MYPTAQIALSLKPNDPWVPQSDHTVNKLGVDAGSDSLLGILKQFKPVSKAGSRRSEPTVPENNVWDDFNS